MNKEEYLANYSEAARDVNDDMECTQEKLNRQKARRYMLEAGREACLKVDRLTDELEQCQHTIDELEEQLEQCRHEHGEQLAAKQAELDAMCREKQAELDAMCREKDAEIAELRQQLLAAQNEHLASECHHLEAEAKAKPLEIHNHFSAGSGAQVFNDKVTGRFGRLEKTEKTEKSEKTEKLKKLENKDKKEKKKRWKKIVRKML